MKKFVTMDYDDYVTERRNMKKEYRQDGWDDAKGALQNIMAPTAEDIENGRYQDRADANQILRDIFHKFWVS